MTRYMFDKVAHPEGLRAELAAAGIPVALVNPVEGGVEVDIPDEFHDAARAIVLAHDAGAYEAAEAAERTRREQDIANVKAFMQAANGSANNQQRDAVFKSAVRLFAREIRELQE
jgi:hypothetical protein